MYTTDDLGEGQDATQIVNWSSNVDDYSAVTALRYKSQAGTELGVGKTFEFEISVETPSTARPG